MTLDDDARSGGEGIGPAGLDHGVLGQRLGFWLRRAQLAAFQDFFRETGGLGLTPGVYSVLTLIAENPRATQARIAEALGIKTPNFAVLVKELEARGWVARKQSARDRRALSLALTETGARALTGFEAAVARHEANLRQVLGADYERLFAALGKIAAMGPR